MVRVQLVSYTIVIDTLIDFTLVKQILTQKED
jgi:hypothetical protein